MFEVDKGECTMSKEKTFRKLSDRSKTLSPSIALIKELILNKQCIYLIDQTRINNTSDLEKEKATGKKPIAKVVKAYVEAVDNARITVRINGCDRDDEKYKFTDLNELFWVDEKKVQKIVDGLPERGDKVFVIEDGEIKPRVVRGLALIDNEGGRRNGSKSALAFEGVKDFVDIREMNVSVFPKEKEEEAQNVVKNALKAISAKKIN